MPQQRSAVAYLTICLCHVSLILEMNGLMALSRSDTSENHSQGSTFYLITLFRISYCFLSTPSAKLELFVAHEIPERIDKWIDMYPNEITRRASTIFLNVIF